MIYFIENKSRGAFKIGYSQDPLKRFEDIQVANVDVLELKYVVLALGYSVDDYKELERVLHKEAEIIAMGRARELSEWFFLEDYDITSTLNTLVNIYDRDPVSNKAQVKLVTAEAYLKLCVTNVEFFQSDQLETKRERFRLKGPMDKFIGNPAKVAKSFRILLDSNLGYRISYNKISEASGVGEQEVRNIMQNNGLTKILIEHNGKI